MNNKPVGWIMLYRKLSDKAYYRKDSEKVHLWIHLLLSANRGEREEQLGGKPMICMPGQFTTGRKQLSMETGISESKIERILTYFEKSEQQIEQQKTNTNRLITVLNWSEYQPSEQQIEQQLNNDRTTTEQRPNTLQEYKEEKEIKNKRSKPNKSADFVDLIVDQFVQAHGSYEIMSRGKERTAAAAILKKYKEKYPAANSAETLESLRAYFNACVNITDPWLHDHMSLSIIVSKFNEINNYLKNGKHKGTGATDAELIELFATKYGVKP